MLFDRSWYNRGGVERVMGFCTDEEHRIFLRQAPILEEMMIESGIHVTKFWFSVTRQEPVSYTHLTLPTIYSV